MMSGEEDEDLSQIGFLFILISGLFALVISVAVITRWDAQKNNQRPEKKNSSASGSEEDSEVKKKTEKHRQKNVFRAKGKDFKKDTFSHPFLYCTLRGHVGSVLDIDYASNGKYLVSTGDDRSMFLWNTKIFNSNDHNPSVSRVELDTVTKVAFAPDSLSVVAAMKGENKLAVYKMMKNQATNAVKLLFAESILFEARHTLDIIDVGIACCGKYLISASSDNNIYLYGIDGKVLDLIETKLSTLYHAAITPDGRFVAACGFVPDVFVFETLFDQNGHFKEVKKAFSLIGHSAGVFSFAFNQDSTRAVTVSKDGTWLFYNTNIRYDLGEEAKVLKRVADSPILRSVERPRRLESVRKERRAADEHLYLVDTISSQHRISLIENVHQSPITAVRISPCGDYFATCGDRTVRVFYNIPEQRSIISELESINQEQRNGLTKTRTEENLENAKTKLKNCLQKESV
ncbi:hypothetical protein L596_002653 [Steinernema carpocapsae]|uniref:Uncharacterized protein n=1 Tax=Steinernema carpocapsae TaxID=34508 RepID=A0A4U8UQ56_STECR|nr:hypothetical protein L596_002653 [Steinernema carpocapsae]